MKIHSLVLVPVMLGVFDSGAWACSFCQGDTSGSRMGAAADWGIIAMVIIMFFMLGAIGAFMYYLAYRAKHPLPDYNELLREGEEHLHTQPKAL